jgi:RNA 2',3'-cyclic 3'-phosphodiesterase
LKYRLFVAIDLPHDLKLEVESLINGLNTLGLPVVWEKPEKLHLTLNFLGNVYDGDIQKVIKNIHDTVSAFPKFTLTPQFLETLYQRHENSLVYLAPTGDTEELIRLQKDLSQMFNEMEMPQPTRFFPHITIGRLKRTDPPTTKYVLDKIDTFEFEPLSSFEVNKITLLKSMVSRAGSVYERLRDFFLNG